MLNAETILAFGIFINCRENGDELTGFVEQIGHFIGGNAAAVHEQFEPILGFFNFLEAVANLGNEFGFRPATRRLAIIRTDGCS